VTADIAESLGLSSPTGALVANAQDDGPAKKAGVVAGDVITQVDGKDVDSPKELARLIAAEAPGKAVELSVWHDGKTDTVKIDLGKLPNANKQASNDDQQQESPAETGSLADFGLTVTKSDDGKGLVVTDVDPDSSASDRGIQAGDIITAVNSTEVNSTQDVTKAIADASKAGRKSVLVQLTHNDNNRFVALPIAKG
jgi:serine protease Do